MRSLQYHPRITRGENKRLTITINTNNYEQTNNFRSLQEESRRRTKQEISESHGKSTIDDGLRERLRTIFQEQIQSARDSNGVSDGILNAGHRVQTQFKIRKNVSGKLFHDIFEIARSYLPNGELVDLHDNYDDCVCYLSEDGTSCFAIEQKTGNLISVFNLGVRKGFLFAIKDYIRKEGATHLDAYSSSKQDLQELKPYTPKQKGLRLTLFEFNFRHEKLKPNTPKQKGLRLINVFVNEIHITTSNPIFQNKKD